MNTIYRIDQDGHWQHFGTPPIMISAPQWLHRLHNGPTQFYRVGKKLSVKADLAIYGQVVDASGWCIRVSLMLGFQLDLSSLPIGMVFVNPVTFVSVHANTILAG